MLLGIWKNIEELEDNVNIHELEKIVEAAREAEFRRNKFLAALNGVDLEDGIETAADLVERKKEQIAARAAGKTEEEADLEKMGIVMEVVAEPTPYE